MLSQEGNEETGVDKAFKTRGSLKAQLSALCGSLTFLLLQMSRFWQPFWTCFGVKWVNQCSGFRITEQRAEKLKGRHWMRQLGNKGQVCSYFTPSSPGIPLPTDHTALLPGLWLGRKEGQPGREWERKSGWAAVSSSYFSTSILLYGAVAMLNTIILFMSNGTFLILKTYGRHI